MGPSTHQKQKQTLTLLLSGPEKSDQCDRRTYFFKRWTIRLDIVTTGTQSKVSNEIYYSRDSLGLCNKTKAKHTNIFEICFIMSCFLLAKILFSTDLLFHETLDTDMSVGLIRSRLVTWLSLMSSTLDETYHIPSYSMLWKHPFVWYPRKREELPLVKSMTTFLEQERIRLIRPANIILLSNFLLGGVWISNCKDAKCVWPLFSQVADCVVPTAGINWRGWIQFH